MKELHSSILNIIMIDILRYLRIIKSMTSYIMNDVFTKFYEMKQINSHVLKVKVTKNVSKM